MRDVPQVLLHNCKTIKTRTKLFICLFQFWRQINKQSKPLFAWFTMLSCKLPQITLTDMLFVLHCLEA